MDLLLPSARWDYDEDHNTGWEISDICRCSGKCLMGQGQLCHRVPVPLQPSWWAQEEKIQAVSSLKYLLKCAVDQILLFLLSTADLHVCSKCSTFQPGWVDSVPSLCVEHIPNQCNTSWWNGLLASPCITKVFGFPSGICRQEVNGPQITPSAGWIKQWLPHDWISV